MSLSPVAIPRISISPAPPQDPIIEPYSPFASIKYPDSSDAFRSRLLTPPPSSPLRSCSSPEEEGFNEGLDSQRFQALLQATRERNARKQNDLRREVTLRAHRSKQMERRARFITRVLARPTNTVVNSPPSPPAPAPPDAISTFVKPDPLSFLHDDEYFGSQDEDSSSPTISPTVKGNAMPSLEEIRVRLVSKHRTVATLSTPGTEILSTDNADLKAPQPRLASEIFNRYTPGQMRASRAQDMLSALKRRTSPPIIDSTERDQEDKKRKRHSAPGDLFPSREREGFQHPVLSVPGGF